MAQEFDDVLSRLRCRDPYAIVEIPLGSGTDNGAFLFVGFCLRPAGGSC